MQQLLALYGLNADEVSILPFGSGLINHTWRITNNEQYILQKINKAVFTNPPGIDQNIRAIDDYLARHRPGYRFITPLPSLSGETMVEYETEYYRLFKFIQSKTYVSVPDASIAFEAARQFGMFTRLLSGFDAGILHESIPHFHDISLRYSQFLRAIEHGNQKRIDGSEKLIRSLQQYKDVVDVFDDIKLSPSFKKRVTHHDTKISNVLFDENNKGIGIIDLDTVMPGFFISDVGDMLRTYLCPVAEEETNFDLIEIRDDYFKAIVEGYLGEMKSQLSKQEVNAFVYSGKFLIYMQALRFLTDYLNDDVYYGAKYELHNFNRATNQLHLLECLVDKAERYDSIVQNFIYG